MTVQKTNSSSNKPSVQTSGCTQTNAEIGSKKLGGLNKLSTSILPIISSFSSLREAVSFSSACQTLHTMKDDLTTQSFESEGLKEIQIAKDNVHKIEDVTVRAFALIDISKMEKGLQHKEQAEQTLSAAEKLYAQIANDSSKGPYENAKNADVFLNAIFTETFQTNDVDVSIEKLSEYKDQLGDRDRYSKLAGIVLSRYAMEGRLDEGFANIKRQVSFLDDVTMEEILQDAAVYLCEQNQFDLSEELVNTYLNDNTKIQIIPFIVLYRATALIENGSIEQAEPVLDKLTSLLNKIPDIDSREHLQILLNTLLSRHIRTSLLEGNISSAQLLKGKVYSDDKLKIGALFGIAASLNEKEYDLKDHTSVREIRQLLDSMEPSSEVQPTEYASNNYIANQRAKLKALAGEFDSIQHLLNTEGNDSCNRKGFIDTSRFLIRLGQVDQAVSLIKERVPLDEEDDDLYDALEVLITDNKTTLSASQMVGIAKSMTREISQSSLPIYKIKEFVDKVNKYAFRVLSEEGHYDEAKGFINDYQRGLNEPSGIINFAFNVADKLMPFSVKNLFYNPESSSNSPKKSIEKFSEQTHNMFKVLAENMITRGDWEKAKDIIFEKQQYQLDTSMQYPLVKKMLEHSTIDKPTLALARQVFNDFGTSEQNQTIIHWLSDSQEMIHIDQRSHDRSLLAMQEAKIGAGYLQTSQEQKQKIALNEQTVLTKHK